MATASVASARSTPARNSPRAAKASVPRTTTSSAEPRATASWTGSQPSASPTAPTTSELEHLDQEQGADLAEQQARARERGGAEPLDHAVAALEAGGDGQRGERRRHHRQREHAGREDVDRRVRERQAHVLRPGHGADQHDHGDHHREQELFAVAQQQPRLHAGLRDHLPGERRGAGQRGEGAVLVEAHGTRPRPVSSRKTSSRLRWPRFSDSGSTRCSSHQRDTTPSVLESAGPEMSRL